MNKPILKSISAAFLLAAFGATSAVADPVYVTAEQQGTTVAGINTDGTYAEFNITVGDYGLAGTAIGRPITPNKGRTYIASADWADPAGGVDIIPTVSVPGGSYYIDYNHNAASLNTTTNVVFAVTCTGGTLDFTSTDKFQRKYGAPANQWARMGKLVLNSGVATPTISFRYQSGLVNGGAQSRLIFDCWRFTFIEPCTPIPVVSVTGPLATNLANVTVTGVSTNATAITLYQNAGTGFTNIGSTAVSSPGTTVLVPVTGQLVKGAQVGATQTVGGQEGCVPTAGAIVGGGANPKLRLALGIRETSDTGPVGAFGGNGGNILFYPCSSVLAGGCPGNDTISITPGTGWQTVTIPKRQGIADSANAVGIIADDTGVGSYYQQSVSIQVYAYKTGGGVPFYSATGAQSSTVTSNGTFIVNWTWDAVAGAEGYRLLRDTGTGYSEYQDVVNATSLVDMNSGWTSGATVTPKMGQTVPSIMWNPTVTATNIQTTWGALDGIMLVSDDAANCGPYNIYIDDLANGGTVFQDFEGFAAGTVAGVVSNQPSYSGQTDGNLLSNPNDASIVNEAAYSGVRSQRVQWQFKETATTPRWIRFNHYQATAMPDPLVNLDEDVSFKILVLPVGVNPVPPLDSVRITNITATAIQYTGGTYSGFGGAKFVLLESANASALLSTWTRAQTNTATPGSFAITPSGTQKFYSIKSE